MRTILVAIGLSGMWVVPASARDLFVNNQLGRDTYDGTAAVLVGESAGPFRTIARALRAADKGDRVVIANTGQPYRESLTLQAGRHSGIPGAPFQLVGNGAVLDGTQPIPADAWEHVAGNVFRFRPPKMRHQMLYLDGKPAARQAVEPTATAPPELAAGEWCLFDRHIYFCTEGTRFPGQYELAYAAESVGLTLYEVRQVVVSDLIVQGFQLDGVNCHDNAVEVTLAGLTCRGNARSGISVGGASRVTLAGCLVGNNGVAQVRTEGESTTRIMNCDLLDNTAPAIVRDGGTVTQVGQGAARPRD